MPVGTALYVYGGGWNRQDTSSGNTAMHIGLPQSWIDFFRPSERLLYLPQRQQSRAQLLPDRRLNQYGYAGWIARATSADAVQYPAYRDAFCLRLRRLCRARRRVCPYAFPKSLGYPFPSGLRQRPAGAVLVPSRRYLQHGRPCGCASVCRTAALSSCTLRPRPVKTDCKGGGVQLSALNPARDADKDCQAYRLAERFMQRYRDGAQGIRRSCCPIRFMGSCRRIRIQGCSGGMIFYRIKKAFGNSLRRRFCKLRIENGEWRITQR